jgi:hypothetical protein
MISDLQNYIANEITEIESVEPVTSELLSKMSEGMEVKFVSSTMMAPAASRTLSAAVKTGMIGAAVASLLGQ